MFAYLDDEFPIQIDNNECLVAIVSPLEQKEAQDELLSPKGANICYP